jgi:hypothetical protein
MRQAFLRSARTLWPGCGARSLTLRLARAHQRSLRVRPTGLAVGRATSQSELGTCRLLLVVLRRTYPNAIATVPWPI